MTAKIIQSFHFVSQHMPMLLYVKHNGRLLLDSIFSHKNEISSHENLNIYKKIKFISPSIHYTCTSKCYPQRGKSTKVSLTVIMSIDKVVQKIAPAMDLEAFRALLAVLLFSDHLRFVSKLQVFKRRRNL